MNYYEVKAISATAIKAGAISMMHMHDTIENNRERTAAMKQGTLQHRAVLETATLQTMIVIEYDGRTKAGKELLAAHGDNLIKPAAFAALERVGDRVHLHKIVQDLGLLEGGEAEKEIFWCDDGIDCKAKLDYLAPGHFVEYKTCSNLAGFARSAASMNYHLQLGWYWHAARRHDGKERKAYIIAQESRSPFDVAVFEVSPAYLKSWHETAMDIAKRYVSGERGGAFPELMTFELPAWVPGAEVSFDVEQTIEF